jgi:hypothetical protein
MDHDEPLRRHLGPGPAQRPPARRRPAGVGVRRRPSLTTQAILDQEHDILDWAEHRLDAGGDVEPAAIDRSDVDLNVAQADAASRVAGHEQLVLIVGPAGTGKTTALRPAVAQLRADGRPVFGVAPSAGGAEVLAEETGVVSDTLDKLLTGEQTALDVVAQSIATDWIDRPALARRAELNSTSTDALAARARINEPDTRQRREQILWQWRGAPGTCEPHRAADPGNRDSTREILRSWKVARGTESPSPSPTGNDDLRQLLAEQRRAVERSSPSLDLGL